MPFFGGAKNSFRHPQIKCGAWTWLMAEICHEGLEACPVRDRWSSRWLDLGPSKQILCKAAASKEWGCDGKRAQKRERSRAQFKNDAKLEPVEESCLLTAFFGYYVHLTLEAGFVMVQGCSGLSFFSTKQRQRQEKARGITRLQWTHPARSKILRLVGGEFPGKSPQLAFSCGGAVA